MNKIIWIFCCIDYQKHYLQVFLKQYETDFAIDQDKIDIIHDMENKVEAYFGYYYFDNEKKYKSKIIIIR